MIIPIPESVNTLHPMASSSDTLRLELKAWEKEFAAAHQGRKASREDIKQNPEIAHKYKLYAKLRSGISQSQPQPSISSPSSHSLSHSTSKRPCPAAEVQTPQKRAKHTHTPHSSQPAVLDAYDRPHSARKSPQVLFRTSIGPTPQKDGKVLGLFDLLSPASSAERTPSKRQAQGSSLSRQRGVELSLLRTPSRNKKGLEDEGRKSGRMVSGRAGLVLSPADASKGAQVSSLLTPTARRTLATPSKSTPCSRRVLEPQSSDETPAFLRRHSQHAYILPPGDGSHEDGLEYDNQVLTWTPVKPRLGPKMAGKGLSALVRGLRELEEEKLDEELDILRELEDGGNARPGPKPHQIPKPFDIADSQAPEMPLGADGAYLSDAEYNANDDGYATSEEPGRGGRSGKEGKPWKKKGQKRTTKRFTLKPVAKGTWKPEPKWKVSAESEDDEEDDEGERKGRADANADADGEEGDISTIAETQITLNAVPPDPMLDDESEGSDANFDPETQSPNGHARKEKSKAKEKGKRERKQHPVAGAEEDEEEVVVAQGGKVGRGREAGRGRAEGEPGEVGKTKTTKRKSDPDPDPLKPKPAPKKKKKISPTAHANFRALKLRNRGSKGNGYGKGRGNGGRRFGRR